MFPSSPPRFLVNPSLSGLFAACALAFAVSAAEPNNHPHAPQVEPAAAASARPQQIAVPAAGERIVFLGNGLAERDVYYSRLETELHLRFPEQKLIVRNLGRPGDTPGFRPHPARVSQWAFPGADQFHPELNSHFGKGFFPTPDQWLTHLKADTIIAFFGYNESFDGPTRVANFEAELDAVAAMVKPADGSRLVVVTDLYCKGSGPGGSSVLPGMALDADVTCFRQSSSQAVPQQLLAWYKLSGAADSGSFNARPAS